MSSSCNKMILQLCVLLGSEHDPGPVIDETVNWHDQSFLKINVERAREFFIDF